MIYNSISFRNTYKKYLENSGQYIYTSSCRVYANEENPIRESSPRLLDVTNDRELLFSDDYCMHKARGEEALRLPAIRTGPSSALPLHIPPSAVSCWLWREILYFATFAWESLYCWMKRPEISRLPWPGAAMWQRWSSGWSLMRRFRNPAFDPEKDLGQSGRWNMPACLTGFMTIARCWRLPD